MTDIEQKALEMISAARKEHPTPDNYLIARTALCRAIEQHEATKREAAEREEQLVEAMRSGIARAEAQHEATKQKLSDFRQRVSDAVTVYWASCGIDMPAYLWFRKNLEQFIIPAPKPDPLVEVVQNVGLWAYNPARNWAGEIRAALDALGFEIREKNDD